MIFDKIFIAPEAKVLKKQISKSIILIEKRTKLASLSRFNLIKKLKSDTLKMACSSGMRKILTSADAPHPEHQALHSIAQIVFSYLCKEPLVDISGGSFCSADYRDALGQLTPEGQDLRRVAHTIIDIMTERKFEAEKSEYATTYLDVINDVTKPNTNRNFIV
jgi:hypothetical protein